MAEEPRRGSRHATIQTFQVGPLVLYAQPEGTLRRTLLHTEYARSSSTPRNPRYSDTIQDRRYSVPGGQTTVPKHSKPHYEQLEALKIFF